MGCAQSHSASDTVSPNYKDGPKPAGFGSFHAKRSARIEPKPTSPGAVDAFSAVAGDYRPSSAPKVILTDGDLRKKSSSSEAALLRRASGGIVEQPHATTRRPSMTAGQRQRRASSVEPQTHVFFRDLTLGRGRLGTVPAKFAPHEVCSMSLKTLLSDRQLCKQFVRFVLNSASVTNVERAPSRGLFQRGAFAMAAGKASFVSLPLPDVEKAAMFVCDLGRLRTLEESWELCLASRRGSGIELRAASVATSAVTMAGPSESGRASTDSTHDADGGERVDDLFNTNTGAACILPPSAFSAAMLSWYFSTGYVFAH